MVSVPSLYSRSLSAFIVTFWLPFVVEIENFSIGTFGPPMTVASSCGAFPRCFGSVGSAGLTWR